MNKTNHPLFTKEDGKLVFRPRQFMKPAVYIFGPFFILSPLMLWYIGIWETRPLQFCIMTGTTLIAYLFLVLMAGHKVEIADRTMECSYSFFGRLVYSSKARIDGGYTLESVSGRGRWWIYLRTEGKKELLATTDQGNLEEVEAEIQQAIDSHL